MRTIPLVVQPTAPLVSFLTRGKGKDHTLYLDVRVTQEACFFGAEAVVALLRERPAADQIAEEVHIDDPGTGTHVPVLVSVAFARYFGAHETVQLALKGRRHKKVVCTNVEPIVKNLCVVGGSPDG